MNSPCLNVSGNSCEPNRVRRTQEPVKQVGGRSGVLMRLFLGEASFLPKKDRYFVATRCIDIWSIRVSYDTIIRTSLRSETDRLNIDICWGFIKKFSLFWDRREALTIIILYRHYSRISQEFLGCIESRRSSQKSKLILSGSSCPASCCNRPQYYYQVFQEIR